MNNCESTQQCDLDQVYVQVQEETTRAISFQRILVTHQDVSDLQVRKAIIGQAMAVAEYFTPYRHWRSVPLSQCLANKQRVLFFADQGMAMDGTEPPRAVYLALGDHLPLATDERYYQGCSDIDFIGMVDRNQFVGKQSQFFGTFDEIMVLCPVANSDDIDQNPEPVFDRIYRGNVETIESGPRYFDRSQLQSIAPLGEGVLSIPSHERQSDRYGLVKLSSTSRQIHLTLDGVCGQHGTLVAKVIRTRDSNAIGDMFRGIPSVRPKQGELLELGTGICFTEGDDTIGVCPMEEREIDWLEPRALWRCHNQTIRLYFVPSASSPRTCH